MLSKKSVVVTVNTLHWRKEALPYFWCSSRTQGVLYPVIPLCQLPRCYLFCPSSWAYLGKIAHYKVWFFLFRGTAVACQHNGIACLRPIWRSREWRVEIVLTSPTDDKPGLWWEPTIENWNVQMTVWNSWQQAHLQNQSSSWDCVFPYPIFFRCQH